MRAPAVVLPRGLRLVGRAAAARASPRRLGAIAAVAGRLLEQARAQDGTLAGAWSANLYLGRTFAYSKQFEDQVSKLTAADVAAALRKHLDPAKVTVVKAGDFKKGK